MHIQQYYISLIKKEEIVIIDSFLDKTIIYHLTASINHAGNKIFLINVLEDKIVKTSVI